MRDDCYLVLKRNGIIKMNKTQPSLESGEVSLKVNVKLPNSIFGKPRFEASIELTEAQAKDLGVVEQLEVELTKLKEKNKNKTQKANGRPIS
jgi:hypothetical protein